MAVLTKQHQKTVKKKFSFNKYNAKKVNYAGRNYDSKLEAEAGLWLKSLLERGKIQNLEYQNSYRINVNGVHIAVHRVDFLVTLNDGRKKYVEIKGFPTPEYLLKKKLMLAVCEIPYLVNPSEKELLV